MDLEEYQMERSEMVERMGEVDIPEDFLTRRNRIFPPTILATSWVQLAGIATGCDPMLMYEASPQWLADCVAYGKEASRFGSSSLRILEWMNVRPALWESRKYQELERRRRETH